LNHAEIGVDLNTGERRTLFCRQLSLMVVLIVVLSMFCL
jgi:hypothetical protein